MSLRDRANPASANQRRSSTSSDELERVELPRLSRLRSDDTYAGSTRIPRLRAALDTSRGVAPGIDRINFAFSP